MLKEIGVFIRPCKGCNEAKKFRGFRPRTQLNLPENFLDNLIDRLSGFAKAVPVSRLFMEMEN